MSRIMLYILLGLAAWTAGALSDDLPPPAPGSLKIQTPVCPEPVYPPQATEQCKSGLSVIRVLVTHQGAVLDTEVATSSGSPILDEAAKKHFASCQYPTPSNFPEKAWLQFRLRWELPAGKPCFPKQTASPGAIRLDPVDVLPPTGDGWIQTEKTDYRLTFRNNVRGGVTAQVTMFSLAKEFSRDEFIEYLRKTYEKAENSPKARNESATFSFSSERPYTCVRGFRHITIGNSLRFAVRMLVCQAPEFPDVGFQIEYAYPEQVNLETEADSFMAGVTYTGFRKRG